VEEHHPRLPPRSSQRHSRRTELDENWLSEGVLLEENELEQEERTKRRVMERVQEKRKVEKERSDHQHGGRVGSRRVRDGRRSRRYGKQG